ncbi:hypothetical protein RHSIM_Rhsim01G0282200 [Rhododendron simsii]|uniref:Cullin N-terminal domain-containing protein n=1 Tax=Rhododendron simsii TaxID=118357 RepID=A0A834HGK5_RHOSS|nr:hypothetical protein RHSIM_Rhsim01G0282200 [Rhododendron simsii]
MATLFPIEEGSSCMLSMQSGSITCFRDLVFTDRVLKKGEVRDAVIDHAVHAFDVLDYLLMVNCRCSSLQKVQNELLVVYSTQLLEKEHSGCRALLRDGKVEDLSRMYRLFHEIPNGLEHIANKFKQHVTAEVTALVQQAEDEANNKVLVRFRKVNELRNKLVHGAVKEAFEGGELLASLFDHMLRKGVVEKSSDEATESTLDKSLVTADPMEKGVTIVTDVEFPDWLILDTIQKTHDPNSRGNTT